MKPLSLKIQYISGICCLVFAVFISLLLYMRLELNKQLENELHKRGSTIARNLAMASIEPIITENHVALQLLVSSLKQDEADILYVYVVNTQQKVIAHTFAQSFPSSLLKIDRPLPDQNKPFIQPLIADNTRIMDVGVAIPQGDFGRIHVGLSEEILKQEMNKIFLHGFPFVAVILLMASAGAWLFAEKITRPVAALIEGVRSVGEGKLGADIDVSANNEIGELARAFNRMVTDLQNRRADRLLAEYELHMKTVMLEEEVSERQKAQEELAVKQQQLEVINSSLENRVNSSLAELRTKDRVMLAQGRQAAMGEMINNIAHQWRQPLNNLGLVVQNIKADYDYGILTPETLTADVNKIMNIIIFMSQTINDFSSFFSTDRHRKVFYVTECLAKVTAMIEATLSKQNIQFVIEQKNDGVSVEGYFNEYNQVLLNILNNAKDELIERGVKQPAINCIISREAGQAVVRIQDNAGGIPDDIITKIFEPYFTTKMHGKGSGIGLYLSKTIIEEHFGGSLSVANTSFGAEFTIATPHAAQTGNG